jgi:hypothetical protein
MPNGRHDDVLVRRTPSDDGMDFSPSATVNSFSRASTTFQNPPMRPLQKLRAAKLASPKTSPTTRQKPPVSAPKEDDFFEELGLSVKPSFGSVVRSDAATSLGATALPPDDNEMASGDWGDDSDLDDLLGD